MKVFRTKKRVAVLVALVVVAISAAAAYAYFRAGATGTGSASTGDRTALTIVQKGTVTGLLPGGPAAPVDFTVTNPTAGNEGLDWVDVEVTGTSTPFCDPAWFTVTHNFQPIGEIDAGQTYDSTTDPGPHSGNTVQMIESGTSQNACLGATVDLSFTASP